MFHIRLAVILSLVLLVVPHSGRAGTIDVNFNSVATSPATDPVTGTAVTNLLASYGITISNLVNPSSFPGIYQYGDAFTDPDPTTADQNMLAFGSPGGSSMTLNFSTPLTAFTFTRVEEYANAGSGFAGSGFTISAYGSSNQLLASVSEGVPVLFQPNILPAATYTLSGPGLISYVTIDTVFGESSLYTNDWVLSTPGNAVPEPSSMALTGLGGIVLATVARRRKRMTAA